MGIKSFLLDDSLKAHEKVMAERAANRPVEHPVVMTSADYQKLTTMGVFKNVMKDWWFPATMITVSYVFATGLEATIGKTFQRVIGKNLANRKDAYIQESEKLEKKQEKKK